MRYYVSKCLFVDTRYNKYLVLMKLNSARLHLFLHEGICFCFIINSLYIRQTISYRRYGTIKMVDGCNVGAGDGLCVCRGRVLGWWRWLLCALCVTRPAHSAHQHWSDLGILLFKLITTLPRQDYISR